ncbi:MAG: hypothetical protein WAU45_13215 [Blastocatellia bacterium]
MAIELKELIDKLGEAHGTNLKSIVLYGSAVAGGQLDEDAPKKVLVVLDRITPAELKASHEVAEWWRLEGNPLPVYFTTEEMTDATDVFPIEFIDMSKLRHVLYGKDPFDGLDIPTTNLRHQLEYELRARLIKLRRLYIPASHDPNRLTRLMAESLDSFTMLFRHVLTLRGIEAPFDKRECVMKLADTLDLDKRVFERIFQCEAEEQVWLQAETDETFGAYLSQIERVIDGVEDQN